MKKTKFTIIDAGIIVVLLAVIVIGIKVLGGNYNSGETKEVYFTVLATKQDAGVSEVVKAGEKVSISFSEEAYATVLGASEEPYVEMQLNEGKGLYFQHEVEGKSDVKVLLKCDAKISDTKIANGNVAIRVGEEMPVCGKGYTIKGYVVEVEEGQGEE
ncbi:MAG: DUF4330 domain-containing protein [Clostridia bacterium]|nr:DUF4330 domain-containing protein [Clostridia bacterium]